MSADDPRCKDCASPPQYGRARCAACAKAHRAQEAARRAERKAEGKCVVCGARAARVGGEPLTVCPAHREYYRRHDHRRRAG